VELVSKACGMLDPIGIYLPRAAHEVAQPQGRGRAPEPDSGPLASADVDSIVDGLIDNVSTIDHEVSLTTKISAAADVHVADGVPNGRAVQVDPIKPTLKAPGTKRLKVKHYKLLSSFAFKFKLRRYRMGRNYAA